jgi:hypothetical protein
MVEEAILVRRVTEDEQIVRWRKPEPRYSKALTHEEIDNHFSF